MPCSLLRYTSRLNLGVRPQMQDRSIPTRVLLIATLRLLPKFLLLVALLALSYAVIHFAFGASKLLAALVAVLYALVFFAAPLASSSIRAKRGVRLFTRPGSKTLLFSFAWGCLVVAGFVATLQLWQGMEATVLNYAVAMGSGGLICAVSSAITSGR